MGEQSCEFTELSLKQKEWVLYY